VFDNGVCAINDGAYKVRSDKISVQPCERFVVPSKSRSRPLAETTSGGAVKDGASTDPMVAETNEIRPVYLKHKVTAVYNLSSIILRVQRDI
jgi:hypothetical protein